MDRCFFWMQDAGAQVSSTQHKKRSVPLETVAEEGASAGDAAGVAEKDSSAAAALPDESMQHEGSAQLRMTAQQAALMLQRLVQSATSRAQRTAHSSPAFPLLQISGIHWDSTFHGREACLQRAPALIPGVTPHMPQCKPGVHHVMRPPQHSRSARLRLGTEVQKVAAACIGSYQNAAVGLRL